MRGDWLELGVQSVLISKMQSLVGGWLLVILILRPRLSNVFINDLDDGTESVLCKFTGAPRLGGMVDTLEKSVALQRDLDKPEK